MRKIEQLKREAIESCNNHNHSMGNFKRINIDVSMAECDECGMQVFIDTNPMPNGIDVSGQAVALYCQKIKGRTNIKKLKERQKRELKQAIKMNGIIDHFTQVSSLQDYHIERICEHTAYADFFIKLTVETLNEAILVAERMNPLNQYKVRDGALSFRSEKYIPEAMFESNSKSVRADLINPYTYTINGLLRHTEEKTLKFFVAIEIYTIEIRINVADDPLTRRSYHFKNERFDAARGTTIINDSGHFTHSVQYTAGSPNEHPSRFVLY